MDCGGIIMLRTCFFFFFCLSKSSLTSDPWVGLTLLAHPDLQKVHMSVGVSIIIVDTGREFIPGSDSSFSWLALSKLFLFLMPFSPSHFLCSSALRPGRGVQKWDVPKILPAIWSPKQHLVCLCHKHY